MNKKILAIGSSGIAAVLLVLAVSTDDTSIQTQEFILSEPTMPEATLNEVAGTTLSVPPRPIMKLISHPVDFIETADGMLDFDVKSPVIPKGYSIQGISSNPESGTFKILLADFEVTEKTTFDEFYANGGILIFIEDHSEGNVDTTNWADQWLEKNDGQAVSINGKPGISSPISIETFEDGSELTQPGKVVYYEGKVIHKVQGIANTNDLITIAESID